MLADEVGLCLFGPVHRCFIPRPEPKMKCWLMMENFVGWYRHASQENMGKVVGLFKELKEVIPGFDSLSLSESGENARALKVLFKPRNGESKSSRYGFAQLSDGQRQLIALYSLLALSGERRRSRINATSSLTNPTKTMESRYAGQVALF